MKELGGFFSKFDQSIVCKMLIAISDILTSLQQRAASLYLLKFKFSSYSTISFQYYGF